MVVLLSLEGVDPRVVIKVKWILAGESWITLWFYPEVL